MMNRRISNGHVKGIKANMETICGGAVESRIKMLRDVLLLLMSQIKTIGYRTTRMYQI